MEKADSTGKALAFAFSLCLLAAGWPMPTRAQVAEANPALQSEPPSSERLLEWVVGSGDNNGMPFVIIDKVAAVVSVYDVGGRLVGAEPALLGFALGDDSAPGIGDRELAAIRPEERTTPAGRFLAAYGPSQGQGKVLWVDFATAISLHAVVTANKTEHRLQRLQSASPEDNRITYGCINVSAEFYNDAIHETFKDKRGVVYILPDTKSLADVFPSLGVHLLASSAAPAPRETTTAAQASPP
jgi:hypothetical protein